MKKLSLSLLLRASLLSSSVSALGQASPVTTESSPSLLNLSGGQILLSRDEWWGVLRAAQDLAGDFGKVTGKNLTLGNWEGGGKGNLTTRNVEGRQVVKAGNASSWEGAHRSPPASGKHEYVVDEKEEGTTVYYKFQPVTSHVNYTLGPEKNFTGPTLLSHSASKTVIIAGTVGKSSLIDSLIASGKLDPAAIKGKWEAFISEVVISPLPGVERALVIAGSDARGTIFGLYDVSEGMGVSPWYWWADVPVRKAKGVWAKGARKVQGSPSVKYRGIFINDEQPGLTNWVNDNYEKGQYGPGFNHYYHPRVFELLLRLRANYFWPAMWGSMFNVDDTANQPLADAFGIVMGSSHTEPMMRATNEWNNFGKQYGGSGVWAYDTNNASIKPFFKYGAQRAAPYAASSLYTMAMRGSHDTSIELVDSEAVKVLENVVRYQREVLTEVFPNTNVSDIPQMWCLYKEVQSYYEQLGLDVPEDITLLWTDDNYGNIRRLPIGNETSRSGGAGVYYHVDYVGDPRSYKWINTIQLSKTVEQMQLAYARQADRIWILNVGDLKALEIPVNHFLDLAYDTPRWGYDSTPTWIKLWATREFGAEHSDTISSILDRYGMYAARRKYEMLDPSHYSVLNYNEADAVLAQWESLADDAQGVYDKLDRSAKPAFYELILQPVLGGQTVNQIYIWAAKNAHWTIQKRNSANDAATDVLKAFNKDAKLTQRYHDLLDGKWNHILDQTHLGYTGYWQQPMRNTAPPLSFVQELETSLAGNLGVGVEASNATVAGDDYYHANSGGTLVLPSMDPYGPTRWIDIFARGTAGCQWTLSPWEPYIILSQRTGYTGGNNGTDTRVYVSIDWANAPPAPNTTVVNINVTSSCGSRWGSYGAPRIQVPVSNVAVPTDFTGFVESDKHISIEASHASRNTSVGGVSYLTLPSHGRTLAGVTLMPVLAATQKAGTGPVLEYDIFTFTNSSVANVSLYLSPSLNQNGALRPLKYGIAFDADPPKIVQFVGNWTGGGSPPGWLGAVSDSVWGMSTSGNTTTTKHNLSKVGKHTLKIWAVEPGVVFQKIIVDFGGVRRSYLGPPESFRAGIDRVGGYKGENFAGVGVRDVVSTG
ncbi:uncharacterized protein RSE6_13758 [Rhynchosporium secalis]|uniref:Gylcosyl hydrolase 115 C-terminal domain-containing protein n=1 Tax=Rhynchosporium secalis TaxID=38038 RepID=A0A1E1MTK8_RHYSE|nr:uncharacterized protein RSE6_13758 [Rhynchosporium secalis]